MDRQGVSDLVRIAVPLLLFGRQVLVLSLLHFEDVLVLQLFYPVVDLGLFRNACVAGLLDQGQFLILSGQGRSEFLVVEGHFGCRALAGAYLVERDQRIELFLLDLYRSLGVAFLHVGHEFGRLNLVLGGLFRCPLLLGAH